MGVGVGWVGRGNPSRSVRVLRVDGRAVEGWGTARLLSHGSIVTACLSPRSLGSTTGKAGAQWDPPLSPF